MTESQIARMLSLLVDPGDKQLIANLRNFQVLLPNARPPATSARGETLLRLRRLGLLEKRPEHRHLPIFEAEHVLTPEGLMIGQIINERCNAALSIPNPDARSRYTTNYAA